MEGSEGDDDDSLGTVAVEDELEEEDEEEEDDSQNSVIETVSSGDLVEISVESLVGTVFEMRLSKRETIANIKLRLQRLEGIPRHQMHLLYRGNELNDADSLEECQIESGATLRLILALRGGPINTRRVPLPQSSSSRKQQQQQQSQIPEEIHMMMMQNKDKILDKIPPNGQVTVLLFREGDQVNMYHVVERPDGTFSPLSDSWKSSQSFKGFMKKQREGENEDIEDEDQELTARLKENAVTMNKMTDLKNQMKRLSLAKKKGRRKRQSSGKIVAKGLSSNRGKTAPAAVSDGISGRSNNNHTKHATAGNPPTTRPKSRKHRRSSVNGANHVNYNASQKSFKGIPLPPINSKDMNHEDEFSSTTTSIFPLNPPGFSRQNSIHHSLFNSHNGAMETVPEWLQKNNFNGSQTSKRNEDVNDDDDIFSEHNNNNSNNNNRNNTNNNAAGDADIIDLNLKDSLRKTPSRLISTDVGSLNKEDKRVQGSMKVSPPRKRNSRRLHSRSLASSLSASEINNNSNNNGEDDIFNRNNAALASRASEHLAAILSSSNNSSLKSALNKTDASSRLNSASTSISDASAKSKPLHGRRSEKKKLSFSNNGGFESEEIDEEETERILYGGGGRRKPSSRVTTPGKNRRPGNNNHNNPSRVSSSGGTTGAGPSFNAARPTSSSSRHRLQQKRKKTPKPRCNEANCRKKLNITNGFPCRCQKIFCAKHRHPEIHNCTFDYKEEGRKMLERANPIVTVPKLPKI